MILYTSPVSDKNKPSFISSLIGKTPKEITIATWTLTMTAVRELNHLVSLGVRVRVVAGVYKGSLGDCRFFCWMNKTNHSKFVIIDGIVWVGSSNLCSDTIFNIMVRLPKSSTPDFQLLFDSLLSGKVPN